MEDGYGGGGGYGGGYDYGGAEGGMFMARDFRLSRGTYLFLTLMQQVPSCRLHPSLPVSFDPSPGKSGDGIQHGVAREATGAPNFFRAASILPLA